MVLRIIQSDLVLIWKSWQVLTLKRRQLTQHRLNLNFPWNRPRQQVIVLGLITICAILLLQITEQKSLAQLPNTISNPNPNPTQLDRFSLGIFENDTGNIGNLEYTTVQVDGEPLFAVAVHGGTGSKNEGKITPIEHRRKLIESKLQAIIQRGFDPNTLTVSSQILNGLTVIQVSDGQTLKPQILRTITTADAELYAQSIEKLAEEITEQIKAALLTAWQERQPAAIQNQVKLSLLITVTIAMITLVLLVTYRWLGHRIHLLKRALGCIVEAQASPRDSTDSDPDILSVDIFAEVYESFSDYPWLFRHLDQCVMFAYYWGRILADLISRHKKTSKWQRSKAFSLVSFKSQEMLGDILLNYTSKTFQDFLKSRLYQIVFARRLLLFFSFILWIRGMAFIFQVFPDTRWQGKQLAGTPISLIFIWFSVLIFIKMSDFLIHVFFRTWQEDYTRIQSGRISRQQIRFNTISGALQGINIAICTLGGLVASLSLFDIPVTTILAGAGILGFAISFGSQSIIKDVIAGITNLMNDSFAVDDSVKIGEFSGTVENMNLFVTRIRCANGDLVTIPNGMITTVCNQTKDWSRVDFLIMVAAATDLNKAIAILDRVALALYNDENWHSKILALPDFKGVEEISHQGIQLRLWLKTLPGEQWAVARELRLRIKTVFEAENILIGIPQQKWVMETTSSPDDLGLTTEPPRVN
ncbi:MAG: mechanosensitive ion channel family protein [Synechocystis sp.]